MVICSMHAKSFIDLLNAQKSVRKNLPEHSRSHVSQSQNNDIIINMNFWYYRDKNPF